MLFRPPSEGGLVATLPTPDRVKPRYFQLDRHGGLMLTSTCRTSVNWGLFNPFRDFSRSSPYSTRNLATYEQTR